MIDEQDTLTVDASYADTCIEPAVWLCERLGVAPPPLFEGEAEAMREIAFDAVYATEPALATLSTRDALWARLAHGAWPASGVAFGVISEGLLGRWFLVRASARGLFLLSLRLHAYPEESRRGSLAMINGWHRKLARGLGPDGEWRELLTAVESNEQDFRRILVVDDFDGPIRLLEARHSGASLSDFAPPRPPTPCLAQQDMSIFRA